MYYILILIAVVLLALQFCANKAYCNLCGSSIKASLTFQALGGAASALISLVIALFTDDGFRVTPFSLIMAAAVSVLCCTYTFLGFKIMAVGSMSVFTMFLMLGGMLLPYLFGVFFLDEDVSVCRIIGVILLAVSMIFPVLGHREENKKTGLLFILLVAAVFVLNGGVSITSKLHQINTSYETCGSAAFSCLSNLSSALICGSALLVINTSKNEKESSNSGFDVKRVLPVILAGALFGGVSYILQLVSAGQVPASVLYPMITGGSMVLNAAAGVIFFREKLPALHMAGLALSFAATFLFLF